MACHLKGEEKREAKLTDSDVRTIRQRAAAGHSMREIAKAYPVEHQCIWQVVARKSWRHVD